MFLTSSVQKESYLREVIIPGKGAKHLSLVYVPEKGTTCPMSWEVQRSLGVSQREGVAWGAWQPQMEVLPQVWSPSTTVGLSKGGKYCGCLLNGHSPLSP